MDPLLKQRLVGASVMVGLAVIIIPAWLEHETPAPAPVVQRDMAPMPATELPRMPATINPVVEDEISSGLEASSADLAKRISPLQAPVPEPAALGDAGTKSAFVSDPAKAQEIAPQAALLAPASKPPAAGPTGGHDWVIQLGSFASRENAESLHAKLRKAGFEAFVAPLDARGKRSYRVRVGRRTNRQEAERLHARLTQELGYSGLVVKGD
jgi:DedD protein